MLDSNTILNVHIRVAIAVKSIVLHQSDIISHIDGNTRVPHTLAKLAICYCILHFGYQFLN